MKEKGGHLPLPRPIALIEAVDTLVDQAQPVGRADQLPQLARDLGIVVARQNAHDARHGPRVAGAVVRAAHGRQHGPARVVGVAVAEHQVARGLVHGIRAVEIPEKGRGQQGGDVGVVHEVDALEAVDLVGVGLLGGGAGGEGAQGVDGSSQGGGQGGHLPGERGVVDAAQLAHDLGGGVEVAREHHVARHEELVDARVVRGPEGGADQAGAVARRVAGARVVERVLGREGVALEGVGRGDHGAVFGVGGCHLRLHTRQDGLQGVEPLVFAEEGVVARGGVVVGRDLEEGGEGVELVLAFEDGAVAVRRRNGVLRAGAVLGGRDVGFDRWLEGLAVGSGENVARLQIDDAAVEGGEGVVRCRGLEEGDVGLHLVGGVAEPHRVAGCISFDHPEALISYMSPVMTNVSSSSEPAAAPFHLIAVSRVFGTMISKHRAWLWVAEELTAVFKEPEEVRVLDHAAVILNQVVDVRNDEGTAARIRPHVGEIVTTSRERRMILLRVVGVIRA